MDTNPFGITPQKPNDPAEVDFARAKVSQAFEAPSTQAQQNPAQTTSTSKHQAYMQELQASGKSLAEVQTAWHEYYVNLSDGEKHEVWQEFYSSNQHSQYQQAYVQAQQPSVGGQTEASMPNAQAGRVATDPSKVPITPPSGRLLNIPGRLVGVKQSSAKPSGTNEPKGFASQFKSLTFGLSMGGLALLFLLFSFFNEFVISPYIQPSRKASAGPMIITDSTQVQGTQATITFGKINAQAPIDFALANNEEATIQESLKNGIVHYKDTAFPGENGNGAYFGHSSGNIFAAGNYKFIFSNLTKAEVGDTFYIAYNGKYYVYKVFAKEIVPPTQVSVLDDTKGKQATAILVTCNPPGFNVNRLVVWGEQISPSLTSNTQKAPVNTAQQVKPPSISSNNTRLWDQMLDKLTFWN